MKPIVAKVLSSGLVDKATAQLMELWGYLPEGSVDKVNEDKLKNATHETLKTLANELAIEVEREHALRETYLDLERLKWPVKVEAVISQIEGVRKLITGGLMAVKDRMGRYYFRIQDVKQEWFVPGFLFELYETSKEDGVTISLVFEKVLQSQILYVGEQGVCLQVTTDKSS